MDDCYDHATDRLAEAARQLRLVRFRLLQLVQAYDQLGAEISELAGLRSQRDGSETVRPVPHGLAPSETASHSGGTSKACNVSRVPLVGRRVLVVDDNCAHRHEAISLLERLGCSVDAVSDGRAAITATIRSQYDLVLMDWRMPEMDGFETMAAIRALAATRPDTGRLPIVAMLASPSDVDRTRHLSIGVDGVLPKPFGIDLLAEILNRCLSRDTA